MQNSPQYCATLPCLVGNKLERALALASAGYSVFPILPDGSKRPYPNAAVAATLGMPEPSAGQGGGKLATRDPEAIQRLCAAFPDALIGIATGAPSGGLVVLDVDCKNGKDGRAELTQAGWQLPTTAWQQTPSGGFHYLYRDTSGRRLPTDADVLGVGLDRRGDGGYIVDYGRFDPRALIASAPDWLTAGAVRTAGNRRPLGDLTLAAPSFEAAVQALNAHDPNDLNRDQWIAVTSAYKQAVSSLVSDDVARLTWDIWCTQYYTNDPEENGRQWRSIRETTVGWQALRDGSPARAVLTLGAPTVPAVAMTGPGTQPSAGIVQRLVELDTHHDAATAFAIQHRGKFIFNASTGQWFYWCGTHWKELLDSEFLGIVRQFCVDGANPEHKRPRNVGYWDGVKRTLETLPEFSQRQEIFDRDNYVLNTPSGTVDLRTGQMHQHQPEYAITRITNASFGRETGSWRKFVLEIMNGDVASAATLQMLAGASLSGAIEEHWLMFLYGQGRNGKSQFVEAIAHALGSYATVLPSAMLMTAKHEQHPTGLTGLAGARFAMSSEVPEGAHFNSQTLKALTGDEFVQARRIAGNWFDFRRQFKLWIVGNDLPQLRTVDTAIRSRLIIVPFNVSFRGREDPDLPAKLRADSTGRLNWLLEGHRAWIEAGKRVHLSGAIEAATAAYFDAQSTPDMWLAECAKFISPDGRKQGDKPTGAELYSSYRRWKEARGEMPISHTRFGIWLKMLPGVTSFTGRGNQYSGIALRTVFDG